MGLHRFRGDRNRHRVLIVTGLAVCAAALTAADVPHLVPRALADGVVLNVPQRMLFVMREGDAAARYPIAVGTRKWPTFIGPFTILVKEVDPVWDVPVSIQEEQRLQGKPVLTRVLPGPSNPLGKYWLGLSAPGYGIHGTNTPSSVGKFATHGCVRLRAEDIEDLFARVEVGTPGLSIYEPMIVAVVDGELWLEAHRDPYGLDTRDGFGFVLEEALILAPALMVDHDLVRRMLRERDGRARRIDVEPDHGIFRGLWE
jgi:L,D-transpeptidase ErfK/SrfK